MFLGEYQNTIDDKGRLMIPPVFREALGEGTLYLTRSTDKCLWLFKEETFKSLALCIDDGSSPMVLFNQNRMFFKRLIINSARPLVLDKTGRLSISPELRSHCKIELKDTCSIIGSNKYLEIWNTQVYLDYIDSTPVQTSDIKNEILESGKEWNW